MSMQSRYSSFPDTRSLVRYSLTYVSKKALDLGAGRAKYKSIILEKCESYTSLDIYKSDTIDVVSDIERTPFADSSFETVYCLQVFEHIPRPWIVAHEIYRLLKKDGVCVVSAPFLQASHADPDDYFRYTVKGLESLFGEDEFEILESGTYGRLYSILFDFIRMIFFNVYKKPVPCSWRFTRFLVSLGNRLDAVCTNDIIYMNSYIIARKR